MLQVAAGTANWLFAGEIGVISGGTAAALEGWNSESPGMSVLGVVADDELSALV